MGSNLLRRIRIWQSTRIAFIAIVYPPIDHAGTRLIGPASEKTNGSEEITLLPKHDFTQRTTPNVIRYNEIRSRRCCQRKDKVFSFFVIDVVKYCFFAIWRVRIAGIGSTPFQKTRAVEKRSAPRASLRPIFDQTGSIRTAWTIPVLANSSDISHTATDCQPFSGSGSISFLKTAIVIYSVHPSLQMFFKEVHHGFLSPCHIRSGKILFFRAMPVSIDKMHADHPATVCVTKARYPGEPELSGLRRPNGKFSCPVTRVSGRLRRSDTCMSSARAAPSAPGRAASAY